MAPGYRRQGTVWRQTRGAQSIGGENDPLSLGLPPVRIAWEEFRRHPVLVECAHGHRVRIDAAVLRGAALM